MLPTNSFHSPTSASALPHINSSELQGNTQLEGKSQSNNIDLETRIELLKQQLRSAQRMATLGELTSTTTHEFNNLLMTILNYAKLGLRHKDDATRDKALQRIYDAANRAGRLTGGVLAMARNRSDSMEPTDLRPIIEDALLLLEREIKKNNVRVETEVSSVPPIMGSGNELQRLLINLLVNAQQATAAGGLVQIKLYEEEKQPFVVLSIRDTGSGIAPDVLPRIFDPYFTTKSGPDSSGRGGTGIGLFACKEIVDAHAGRIRVESTLGKGTAFTIRFPKIVKTAAGQ